MKIAVAITDARMEEVYRILSACCDAVALRRSEDYTEGYDLDALVLPVKGITDEGNLIYQKQMVNIPMTFWHSLSSSCQIFCGMKQRFLEHLSRTVHYYMEDEELLKKNAVLTAEGCLFLLIDNTPCSIRCLAVDIIGYGRCGKEIHSWLDALGVSCRIVRRIKRSDEHAVISVEQWRQVEPADVIINTSIQPIMDAACMDQWIKKPLIIDIATPDVVDSTHALQKGIRFIKAGNLPSLIAYQSAGGLIAQHVKEKMKHER